MALFQYWEFFVYAALLCFMLPIRIEDLSKSEISNDILEQFENYVNIFNKTYNHTEKSLRLEAFQHSLKTIELLNSNRTNGSALYGLTKFSDLLPEEFQNRHLQKGLSDFILNQENRAKKQDSSEESDESLESRESRAKRSIQKKISEKIDWRMKNVVTKVRNQEFCGACWAFSGIETIESMYAIKHGRLLELSVQEMIDCAGYNNDGCDGGDICTLMEWLLVRNVSIASESEYPLDLRTHKCRRFNSTTIVKIADYGCLSLKGNEQIILDVLDEMGPVAVAINAQSWQNYIEGVIQYHCSGDFGDMNHAVQIVGYDLTADIPHYIVRNSWGEDFGDKGYLYIAINQNVCGVANQVTPVTVL